jgi:1-phosphofructokinase family hexose kinase
MILCVTLNPAIDRTLIVPNLRHGEVNRAERALVAAGGKGINVARAARTLGAEVLCAGFLGGHSGRLVADLAEREGLRGAWTWIDGETRTCVITADPHGGDVTVINEPGPAVAPADWARLTHQIASDQAAARYVCLSGSLPPNSAPGSFAALLRALLGAGQRVWVDSSGAGLEAALAVGAVGVKVNGAEAGQILGRSIAQPGEALAAARELRQRTGTEVVLTLGERGAVLLSDTGGWHARPPAVQVVSAVGSGDSFLAGLVTALASGLPEPESLRYAVAAGAANALSVGGGLLNRDDVDAILARTSLERIG